MTNGNVRATTRSPAEHLSILQTFADSSSDALVGGDADGRITMWNRSAERIFGYPEAEILGQAAPVLFPEHLRADVEHLYATVVAGDRVDHLETEARRKGGMPIPVSICMRGLVGAGGRTVGTVSTIHDLTETRLAQATLAEVEARLKGGEAQTHVGRWLWDIGTGAVQWSDELHRIHGIDPLDFEGTLDGHLRCAHPDDALRLRQALDAARASGQPFEEEYRIVRPDGQQRWIYLRAEPTISSAGAVVGFRGIAQDVSDRWLTPGRSGS